MYKARDKNTGRLVALKKTRLEVCGRRRRADVAAAHLSRSVQLPPQVTNRPSYLPRRLQMEEEGVPSTTLREISLLQMLSESNHIVK